ncbi:MAG: DJ-1/PfpI family protein [Lachnospiraceae bacterium]|nr:DJ-1/PfpI family protein [Lachnospiraceae bacterium]
MAKVAIFLADGFEEVEAIAPIDILRRGGVEVSTVSVMGRTEVKGSHDIYVQADMLLEDLDFGAQDMLILPGGGLGTQNLRACEPLLEKVKEFDAAGKYIAAICAAPTVFGQLGLLKGKRATCYGGMEEQLTGAEKSTEAVVVDGHIITSRGMGTATLFGLKLLEIFTDKATADDMAAKVMMP